MKRMTILAMLVVFATCTVGATASQQLAQAGQAYKVVGKWGKSGTANGQFAANTSGIAVDKAGNVYVADTDNNRIQVFSKAGAFSRKWGSIGAGNGQFASAEDIAVAPNGTVWVADRGNSRLQLFTSGGAFRTAIATPAEQAQGVAVDGDGNGLASVEGESRGGYRTAGSRRPGKRRAASTERGTTAPMTSRSHRTAASTSSRRLRRPTTTACAISPPTENPSLRGSSPGAITGG